MLKLYENIKSYRQLKGWSQDELAAKVGYKDRTIISKIERGDVDLSQSKIITFANAFGISPGELMGNDGCSEKTNTLPSDSEHKLTILDAAGMKEVINTIDREYDRCLSKEIDRIKKLDKLDNVEDAKIILGNVAAFGGYATDDDLLSMGNAVLRSMKK